jgi:hypothetical protein
MGDGDMPYLLIRVHSFACDYPGCTKEEEHAEPTKEDAAKIMRGYGWQIGKTIRCPRHRRGRGSS